MTLATRLAAETATWMGLVPLAAVSVRRWRGARPDVAYWLLAAAFGVSWLADTAARWLDSWSVTFSYVIAQSVIVAAVYLGRRNALRYLGALGVVGVVAMFVRQITERDLLLHAVAWTSVALIVLEEARGAMRNALACYFALGAMAYLAFAAWPGWGTWLPYQATRAIGIAWFCWAASERSMLRVVRRAVA